jgi:hypothetical protein
MIIKDDAHAAENVMRPRLMSNPQHVHSRNSRRPRGSRLWLAVAVGLLLLGARSEADRELVPPPALEVAVPDHALFADDFSTSELEQWRTEHQGFWSVRAGMLRADLPDRKHVHSLIHAGDSTWRDYVLEFDVCGVRGVDKGAVVRVTGDLGLGVDLRGTGYNDMRINLKTTPLGRVDVVNGNGIWHRVRLEIIGRRCRVSVGNEVLLDRYVPKRLPPSGGIALAAYTGGVGECTVYFDNVVVTPLN